MRHIGSPKEKPTRGELDARVVRGTEEVQKGSRSEVNWTLELREARRSPKEKSTRGGLDFKVEKIHEKVQNKQVRAL